MSYRYTTLHGTWIYQVMSCEKEKYIYLLVRIFDRKFNQIQGKVQYQCSKKKFDLENKA